MVYMLMVLCERHLIQSLVTLPITCSQIRFAVLFCKNITSCCVGSLFDVCHLFAPFLRLLVLALRPWCSWPGTTTCVGNTWRETDRPLGFHGLSPEVIQK